MKCSTVMCAGGLSPEVSLCWSVLQAGPLGPPDGQQHGYVYGTSAQGEHVSGYSPYMAGSSAMGLPALQAQSVSGQKDPIFPERPGQPECQYYMKTGDCKFGITCRYHHPKDRATPSPTCVLSPIGLPLRPVSLLELEELSFCFHAWPYCKGFLGSCFAVYVDLN